MNINYVDSRTPEERDADNKKGYGTFTTAGSLTHKEVITMTHQEQKKKVTKFTLNNGNELSVFGEAEWQVKVTTQPTSITQDEWFQVWADFTNHIRTSDEVYEFFDKSIAQAIAEDRERVVGEIYKKRKNILWEKHNRLDINLDESKGYNQALDDLLSSLDKPLTDNKDI